MRQKTEPYPYSGKKRTTRIVTMSLKTLLDELNNGKAITYLDQERMLPLCELHTFRRYFIRLEVVEGIPIDVEQIRKGRTMTNVYRLGLEVDA